MSWLEVASQIRYPKCAVYSPSTVMQWAVSSGQAWALCLPRCCPGVSLGRFCPFSIPIPLCNSRDCSPTSPRTDLQTNERVQRRRGDVQTGCGLVWENLWVLLLA